MSKFTIGVTMGVANAYPQGQSGAAKLLHAGDVILCEVGPQPRTNLLDQAATDLITPAAGVALTEPFGNRDGELEVKVSEGAVTVRHYEGPNFMHHEVAAGEKVNISVTETNRITLAVYELSKAPK